MVKRVQSSLSGGVVNNTIKTAVINGITDKESLEKIKSYFDVDAESGVTVMMYASEFGSLDTFKYLVDNVARYCDDTRDTQGRTCAMYTIEKAPSADKLKKIAIFS
jgi:hypothetical protein